MLIKFLRAEDLAIAMSKVDIWMPTIIMPMSVMNLTTNLAVINVSNRTHSAALCDGDWVRQVVYKEPIEGIIRIRINR